MLAVIKDMNNDKPHDELLVRRFVYMHISNSYSMGLSVYISDKAYGIINNFSSLKYETKL